MAIVGIQLTEFGLPETRRHMHAGKRPSGPCRCDGATGMQLGGLDALENTAGLDPRLARQVLSE